MSTRPTRSGSIRPGRGRDGRFALPTAMAILPLACLLLWAMSWPVVAAGREPVTEVEAVTVRNGKVTLGVGERKRVVVDLPVSAAGQPLTYESGNSGFATVDERGVLTGIHEGVTALSIIAANGVRTDIRVEVQPRAAAPAATTAGVPRDVPDEGIVIANAGGRIEIGRIERIVAHVLPYQVIGANPFTVTSSDPSIIAAIDEAKVIRAVKEGTATVSAVTLDGKHRASVTYTVVAARQFDSPDAKTYHLEPARFGIRYDEATEEAAKANSAGLYQAMRHTADGGFTRLLLEPKKVIYIEPRDTIHMVSHVQLDLNGSEIRLRPNDYPRYVAFLFAEKDRSRVLENASIVNGTLTGERDHKEAHFPNWARTPETEGGCTIEFDEGYNNGIRNLTVRKSIGFNIASGLGSKSHGVRQFSQSPVSVGNMERGAFDADGKPVDTAGQIRTKQPLSVAAFTTPYYTLGYPLGYMGYPFMNSRIYDAYFFDKDMKLLSAARGLMRYRQYALPQDAAFLHLAFYHADVPASANSDFGNAFAFVENRAMPIDNYIIDCIIEDNYSTGVAACGGQGWLIKNNVFRRNGGRMPGCDIDWEDGWEYMQSDLVEGNTFESRLNVITCAGVGLVFHNNTFRGESVFYGRTQHYSLLDNVFEKAQGDSAHAVKVSLSSQSDIYSFGNRYTHASVGYARQHAKEPFIGTYEATFVNETFDNTQILQGHITRLVHCTIRHGSDHALISTESLLHCTIERGSYTAAGTIRNATIRDATFRVAPGSLLQVHDSKLINPSFAASGQCQGVAIDRCTITVDEDKVLVTPNDMKEFAMRNSTVTIGNSVSTWTLVGGWDARGADTTVTLDAVRFALPTTFEGYLHKFAWYPPATDGKKLTYDIRNTDVSKFHRTDDKGKSSNAVFNIPTR